AFHPKPVLPVKRETERRYESQRHAVYNQRFRQSMAAQCRRGIFSPSERGPWPFWVSKGRMRGLTRTLAFVVLFSSILTVGESVRSLFNKGVKAEARQDYEAAYEFYK